MSDANQISLDKYMYLDTISVYPNVVRGHALTLNLHYVSVCWHVRVHSDYYKTKLFSMNYLKDAPDVEHCIPIEHCTQCRTLHP